MTVLENFSQILILKCNVPIMKELSLIVINISFFRVWYGLSTDSLSTRPFYQHPVYRQTVLSTRRLIDKSILAT
jgi:hypothetical protein